MKQFKDLLTILATHEVEFILIGGVAGVLHGAARATYDVDVVYNRTPENIEKLARALAPHKPYLRGAPPGLPFLFDAKTIERGLNFTLTTLLGDLDLLGEATGGGTYAGLKPHVETMELLGLKISCVDLPTLIRLKRACGRPKDLEAIAELESIPRER